MPFAHTHLLAIAAAISLTAVGAQAQSSVSLYGLVDLSAGSSKAPGGESSAALDSGKMTTSYWGIGGKEDLGGGLSAVFRLESFLRADTGSQGRFDADTTFSRTASVGLSSTNLGTLSLGRNTTALFVSTLLFNAFGDSFGYSPSIRHYFTSGTVTGDTAWSDSVAYSSPNMGGVRFGLAGATKEGGATSNGGNWSANVGYSNGPFASSLVAQQVKKDGSSPLADTRTVQLGASYDFGAAKVYGQYGDVDNLTAVNTYQISGLGARIPVGAGAVLAQWGQISPNTGSGRKTLSLGYLHNLSKRTELYAAAMSDKVDDLSSGSAYSLGIRHRF
ncbi:MAG: porin [Hydrogenophaga sp.]